MITFDTGLYEMLQDLEDIAERLKNAAQGLVPYEQVLELRKYQEVCMGILERSLDHLPADLRQEAALVLNFYHNDGVMKPEMPEDPYTHLKDLIKKQLNKGL